MLFIKNDQQWEPNSLKVAYAGLKFFYAHTCPQDWPTHSKAVGDGRRALRYLAPYVFRVAISNRRIVNCEPGPDGSGRVTLSYRKSGSRRYRPMELTAEEFIRRFLQAGGVRPEA